MVGIVTRWSNAGGYGFVTVAGGNQYFLHCTNFIGHGHPDIGRWVSFGLGKPLVEGRPDQCVSARYATKEEIGLVATAPVTAISLLKGGAA